MYIPLLIYKFTPSVDYNKWLKNALDFQLNEPANKNLVKVPKVVMHVIKTLRTSVINSPMSPPFKVVFRGPGGQKVTLTTPIKIIN